jgi:hypothetical protein
MLMPSGSSQLPNPGGSPDYTLVECFGPDVNRQPGQPMYKKVLDGRVQGPLDEPVHNGSRQTQKLHPNCL